MSEAPWVRWFASDFLNGVADLEADERGVYITILSLIFDRGAPIEDDASWIARRSGCSTRRFNQIRLKLIEQGKLEVRNGMLGNRKALEEVKRRNDKSNKTRHAALARWYKGDEPELPLDEKEQIISGKSGALSPEHNDLKSRKKRQKPQSSAISDDANASRLAGAREEPEPELERRDSSPTAIPRPRVEAEGADPFEDLLGLTERLARIGGVPHVSPSTILMNVDVVKGWIAAGVDIELTVVKAIKEQFKNAGDQNIGSLRFYAGRVAKLHAKATPKAKGPAPPPLEPIYTIAGEEPAFVDLRRDLAKAMGENNYAKFCNTGVTFERVDEQPIVRVKGQWRTRVTDHPTFATIAKRQGFLEVW